MDIITQALCRKYVQQTAVGLGAVKGHACQVEKTEDLIEDNRTGQQITLKWYDDNDVVYRKVVKIYDGVTPLMYMGMPRGDLLQIETDHSFDVNSAKFNRQIPPPQDGELFFTYLIVTDNEKIYLYAAAATYDATNEKAILTDYTKIATTGLKALVAYQAIDHDLTNDDSFDIPANIFSRMPDGDAEECLIFDIYGHYRSCTLVEKNATTITITPSSDVVNINIGSVRYNHIQSDASDEWVIQHNLNFQHPTVLCVDDNGNEIYGDINYNTMNLLTITFSDNISGTAQISK